MKLNENIYLDLPQRITEIFHEIDSDICMELLHADEKYAELFSKSNELQKAHPFIMRVLEGYGASAYLFSWSQRQLRLPCLLCFFVLKIV